VEHPHKLYPCIGIPPRGFKPLVVSLHITDQLFPRSAQAPMSSSCRLYTGCHLSSKQNGFAHEFVIPAPRAAGFGRPWAGQRSDRTLVFLLRSPAVIAHASNVQCFLLALGGVHAAQHDWPEIERRCVSQVCIPRSLVVGPASAARRPPAGARSHLEGYCYRHEILTSIRTAKARIRPMTNCKLHVGPLP